MPKDRKPPGEDALAKLQSVLASSDVSGPNNLLNALRKRTIEIFAGLSPRERDVIRLRFGLDDGRPRSHEEIGALFGVTSARVRTLERNALAKFGTPSPPDPPRRPANVAGKPRTSFFADYSRKRKSSR